MARHAPGEKSRLDDGRRPTSAGPKLSRGSLYVTGSYWVTGLPTRRIANGVCRSNVRNLLPDDFTVFGHAVHHPRWRDQDHQPILEPYPPRLFCADPARIRRRIDRGNKLLAVVRVRPV